MNQWLSIKDLQLLGYSEVSPDPRFEGKGYPCDVFLAVATAGLRKVDATFVYLKSRATRKQAEEILGQFPTKEDVFVVVPQSTKGKSEITTLCRSRGLPCLVHEDLLWERASSLFREYIESLGSRIVTEKYYVQPRREGDSRSELDRELMDFLKGKSSTAKGKLFVLCAPAGVGKTTLGRYLTVTLAKQAETNRLIPIYVEAQHWSKLQLETVDELWAIISNSLSMYSSSLRISKELFDHMLQQGLICFIFDGFDELCSHRHFTFRASTVLDELAGIARESEARLILTTRTLYWNSEIAQCPPNVETVDLAPFNTQQAKGYFSKYFADNRKFQDRAFSLYKALQKRIQPPTVNESHASRAHFANLPLCVAMVAECVKLGAVNEESFQFEQGIVHGFLRQICEREQERQKLRANADLQLLAFEEVTMETPEKQMPDFDLELLEQVGLEPEDVKKMISHPLLQKSPDERYRFSYDFLPHYFKARHLASCLHYVPAALEARTLKLMSTEANGKGFLFDYIYDICRKQDIANLIKLNSRLPRAAYDEKSFVFHLTKTFISHDPSIKTNREKMNAILEILCSTEYHSRMEAADLVVIGKVDGLDFSGITFRNCKFIDVTFSNCSTNVQTNFENCAFSGELDFVNCNKSDWANVRVSTTCTFHPPANLAWEHFAGSSVGSKEDHIKDAMRLALAKFWKYGRLEGSIRQNHWSTGSLGRSIYCNPLRDAMLKVGLITEGHTSGVTEGCFIFDRGSLGELQKFMDGRQLTGKLRKVYQILMPS